MTSTSVPRWKVVLLLGLLGLLGLAGYTLRAIFIPILIAFALAYLLNPVVLKLERLGLGRTASILALYVLAAAAAAGFLIVVLPPATVEMRELYQMTFKGESYGDLNNNGTYDRGEPFTDLNASGLRDPSYLERASGYARRALRKWNEDHPAQAIRPEALLKRIQEAAEANLERVTGGVSWAADRVVGLIASGIQGVLVVLSFILLVPLYLFGFLKYFGRIRPAILSACPAADRDHLSRVLHRIDSALSGFFRGQILIGLVKGTLMTVALMILGVPYPLLLGILYGLFSIVPYGGLLAGFPLIELVAVIDSGGAGIGRILGPAAAVGVIEAIEGALLVPFLHGRGSGLHPLVLLVCLFVFGQLLGLFGVLAAVPLTATAKILIEEYLLPIMHDVAEGSAPQPAASPPPDTPGPTPA